MRPFSPLRSRVTAIVTALVVVLLACLAGSTPGNPAQVSIRSLLATTPGPLAQGAIAGAPTSDEGSRAEQTELRRDPARRAAVPHLAVLLVVALVSTWHLTRRPRAVLLPPPRLATGGRSDTCRAAGRAPPVLPAI
jgi:hypothetical protein